MPRIPQYERSVGLTEKGPAVEVDSRSFAVQAMAQSELWGTVGKSAAKVADLGFDINDKMVRAKMSDDFGNMVVKYNTEYYDLQKTIKEKPPEQWEGLFKEGAQKLMEDTLAMSSYPGVQTAFKRHWAMHFPAQNHQMIVDGRKQQIANFIGNKDVYLKQLADMAVSEEDPTIRTQRINEANIILQEGVLNGLIKPHEKNLYIQKFNERVQIGRLDKEINQDAPGAYARLQEPDKNYPGLDPEIARHKLNEAHARVGQQRQEMYDQVIKGINKNQLPTQDQIDKLSGTQQHTVTRLIKSMGDEDNKTNVAYFGDRVLRLKADSPESAAEGGKLYNDILDAKGLSNSTRWMFMNTVMSKINGQQMAASKFQDQYLLAFNKLMTPDQHKLFMIDYGSQPNGVKALSPEASATDKIKNMNEFALPYINASRDEIVKQQSQKAKKGKTALGYLEQEVDNLGGGGKEKIPPPSPLGETVFKDGKTYKVVTVDGKKMVDPNPIGEK